MCKLLIPLMFFFSCIRPWDGPCEPSKPKEIPESPYSTKVVRDGEIHECHADGKWKRYAKLCMGFFCTVDISWDSSGQKMAETEYASDGKKHGVACVWTLTGKPRLLRYFNHGKPCGNYVEFDNQGNEVSRKAYEPCPFAERTE